MSMPFENEVNEEFLKDAKKLTKKIREKAVKSGFSLLQKNSISESNLDIESLRYRASLMEKASKMIKKGDIEGAKIFLNEYFKNKWQD